MNILFIVPSYKPAYIYGGPIVVIARLAEQLVKMGHTLTVYTTAANGKTELDVSLNIDTIVDGVHVHYFKRITKDHTHVSPALWKALNRNVKTFDVVHIHSWCNFLTIGATLICKINGIKPVLSPHGMLSTYILKTNNSLPKKILHAVIGKYLLKQTWLHVSTGMEWDESVLINSNWKGEVIPNLVELPQARYDRKKNDVFTIGFLSRVDPKKGLDILIQALSKVSMPYKLLIAGDGDDEYISALKQLIQTHGMNGNVQWVGWKKGEEKFDFFSTLDLYALTSHSENFAIVVIESLSVGTPVLISNQVGLYKYVLKNDMGWVVDLDAIQIAEKIEALVHEKNKIHRINEAIPEIIKEEYNDFSLANEYVKFYINITPKQTN